MLNEQELRALADEALSQASGYDAELIISTGDGALTRFGESRITQNVAQGGAGVSVRLVKGGRMGKASTGNLTKKGMASCIVMAKGALGVAEPDSDLIPLPEAQKYTPKPGYFETTAAFTPEERAEGVKQAVKSFEKEKLEGAGIFSSGASAVAIANSKGLWAYHKKTGSAFSISAIGSDSSGWAQDGDPDISKVDVERAAEVSLRKAVEGRNPGVVDPGPWTVIMEPAAVADFSLFMAWEAFNGKSFVEGRSPFSGKSGQKIVGENITILDDAWHPLTPGQPFDYEGMPRQRVTLIEKGIFRGTVHDRATGPKAGLASTGHALPQPDSNGPMPVNMVFSAGDSSVEEMIASTERGLLVTRLHYCNILDPMKLTITGMTRDGLFLIEKGKVVRGVKNMRFTESILSILSNVEAISKQLYKTETFWGGGGTVAPAMKIKDFHFTSKTEN
jgi:PmbA protein